MTLLRRWRCTLALLALGAALAGPALADPPRRVVSMNLCTDQLAMLLAAPEQLVSVTFVASDPRVSAMAEQAADIPANHGRAEEIFLMRPDLVVAGSYTTGPAVDMLRRLGIPVIEFLPATSMAQVRERLHQMGDALGRPQAAARAIAAFDARLAALPPAPDPRPRAALFEPNGYTAGSKTLAGQILTTAGFDNIAAEMGFDYAGNLSLEQLVMADPDVIISSPPYPGASRSEDIVTHPAAEALRQGRARAQVSTNQWVCGTPHILQAVETLIALRESLPGAHR